MKTTSSFFALVLGCAVMATSLVASSAQNSYQLTLTERHLNEEGQLSVTRTPQKWEAAETAVIVCDMWDAHHCLNATERGKELVSRMNALLLETREKGSVIIHSPSSCMDFYKDHPARKRAQAAPVASNHPEGIEEWCHWINESEEKVGYPIDHSDGGEDDDPDAHEAWAKTLEEMGRNPEAPWIRQAEGIDIDAERDAITDDGKETWNLLEERGIKNVVLLGVHTNMCVLGRPFGLRQMAKNGKNVVLVRDLTDTMYNPAMPPFVSHFHGTDLVIEHVETYVCPTITSDQILGGSPFRFAGDKRKRLVMLLAEDEYKTEETLPVYARAYLGDDFHITALYPNAEDPNRFEGIETVANADVILVSVRRRALPKEQLDIIRAHVAAGKPMVGIRTASHAFSLRGESPGEGSSVWEEFDAEVWGGNYHGHHGNEVSTWAQAISGSEHPILRGVAREEFSTGGSLYEVMPLQENAELLMMGRAEGIEQQEPVAWTFETEAGGRSFYSSLGHAEDFASEPFLRLLTQGIHWASEVELPAEGLPLKKTVPLTAKAP